MKPIDLRIRGALSAAIACLLAIPTTVAAQYTLVPSSALDVSHLSSHPEFSGYVAVRDTRRGDTSTFALSRVRPTLEFVPTPYLALKIQVDLAGAGRIRRDSTVPGFLLTDAFVQLQSPDTVSGLGRLRPRLLVGQFKLPFSLEYLTSYQVLLTPNRALVVDRLSLKRDIGAMVQLEPTSRVSLAMSLTNGEGANAVANTNGRQLASARLSIMPISTLALAAKIADEGADHVRGYDARYLAGRLTIDGESIHRDRAPTATTPRSGGGSSVLVAVRALPWLSPVVRWEQEREQLVTQSSATWVTYGLAANDLSSHLRGQLAWTTKREHPIDVRRNDELMAQMLLIF